MKISAKESAGAGGIARQEHSRIDTKYATLAQTLVECWILDRHISVQRADRQNALPSMTAPFQLESDLEACTSKSHQLLHLHRQRQGKILRIGITMPDFKGRGFKFSVSHELDNHDRESMGLGGGEGGEGR